MSFSYTQENSIKIASLLNRYPQKKALVLPLLWLAQKQESYISEDAIRYICEFLDLPYMHIYGVVTFYTMFRVTPPQKKIVEVCRTLSCELSGSEDIKRYLDDNYSEDYEIVEVECMGACCGAPMCSVDGKYHENLTTQRLDDVLHVK